MTNQFSESCNGGMAEWSKALALNTSEGKTSEGSNPSPSAKTVCAWCRWCEWQLGCRYKEYLEKLQEK